MILCSCEFDHLQHWAEFQRILPNPNSYYGVLSDYLITSLCTSMGFRNDHRFHCSETFRQNRRACVSYRDPFHGWDCEFHYFPQHDEHCQSLCSLVRISYFFVNIRLKSRQILCCTIICRRHCILRMGLNIYAETTLKASSSSRRH